MSNNPASSEKQAVNGPLMVVFDAPDELKHAFLQNGFLPHGRQPGAWHLAVARGSDEARDLEYELNGVGLRVKWWQPG